MAHAALHFAAGLAVGMALQSPRLRTALTTRKNIAPAVVRWLGVSWGLGIWSILPSLLRYTGVPESFCSGWWMNVFLLHPLINQYGPHATIIGAVAFVAGFTLQYAVILSALARCRSAGKAPSSGGKATPR